MDNILQGRISVNREGLNPVELLLGVRGPIAEIIPTTAGIFYIIA